jgi:hypothetical protein
LPVILDAYRSEDKALKGPSAAFLACRLDSMTNQSELQSWQGFNFSDQTAEMLLDQNKSSLQKFVISTEAEYGRKYVTIETTEYFCNPEYSGFE